MCSDHVKCTLFRSFCTSLYTCQLWCSYQSESIRKLYVTYNNVFRLLCNEPRYCSASYIVTDGGVCVPSGRRFDISILCIKLIRATTDRHQRSVINNVYSLDMTTQLIRQEHPSTVPVHPCTHTTNPHTAHLLESVHGTHARTTSLSDLCFTGRQLSD